MSAPSQQPGSVERVECERCEGYGTCPEFAPCTTFGHDCGCNGPRIEITCPDCDGFGTIEKTGEQS